MHIDIDAAIWRELLATEPHVQASETHHTLYYFDEFVLKYYHDFEVIHCVHSDITDVDIVDYIHALVV